MSKIIELPALIDPHCHFRTPGAEYKEDYQTGPLSAYFGGIGFVGDMPNTNPATTTKEALDWKINEVRKNGHIYSSNEHGESRSPEFSTSSNNNQIEFGFHFGATNDNIDEIIKVEDKIKSIKVYYGSSTGDLLVNNLNLLEKLMTKTKKIITVHAEDEQVIQKNLIKYKGKTDPEVHSLIRNPDSAYSAVEKLISLVRKTNHPVYFCHISTKGEVELIKAAKKEGLPIFAEVTPHHLFLDTSYYQKFGNYIKVNPPIRDRADVEALWGAINEGIIDTIGSDHAPHLPAEKEQDYLNAPAGIPGVETTLPLMLNAVNEGRLSLERLVELMSKNPSKIFDISTGDKKTIIDLELKKEVRASELHSKCGWTPYEGLKLRGWPIIK